MTPRDDFSNSNELNDETTPYDTPEIVPIEESNQLITDWAESEGYTPLSELNFGLSGGDLVFMAAPPDLDGPAYAIRVPQDSFFAQLDTFESAPDSQSDDALHERLEDNLDFRVMADQALKSLEDDYAQTVGKRHVENSIENTEEESKFEDSFDERMEKVDAVNQPSLSTFESIQQQYDIDTAAVQRAVASIQLNDTKLSRKYHEWQRTLPPLTHDLIPPSPLTAFRTSTTKARRATSNLTRSATIAHALHLLDILEAKPKSLLLYVLGVDHVETRSVDQIRSMFCPLVRWLAASASSLELIEILLIGPNAVQQPTVDLIPNINTQLQKATASCHVGAYHDLAFERTPQLTIAFNAGIWGYSDWLPTLEALKGIVFVVTAYTLQEAQDDEDVLIQYPGSKPIWSAELNPFGSTMLRDTVSNQNRVYRENAAWQAWIM